MVANSDIFEFRSKYPELTPQGDSMIAATLNTVDVMLDSRTWPNQVDFALARMTLAAHLLTMQRLQVAAFKVGGSGLIDLFVQSIAFGERTVGFGRRTPTSQGYKADPGETMLEMTAYGQLFVQLRARNIIPVMIV